MWVIPSLMVSEARFVEWLGAGRLTWKQISRLYRRGPLFVLRGGSGEGPPGPDRVRFLLVEDLERLVHLILERSPNLRFPD